MSEPIPPNPPEHPPTLSYQTPVKQGLPIGVQAFLGSIATLAALGALCVGCGFLAVMSSTQLAVNAILIPCFALTFVMAFLLARRLKLRHERRGWAIGIYIGMGLAGLFWGYCGVLLNALSGPH